MFRSWLVYFSQLSLLTMIKCNRRSELEIGQVTQQILHKGSTTLVTPPLTANFLRQWIASFDGDPKIKIKIKSLLELSQNPTTLANQNRSQTALLSNQPLLWKISFKILHTNESIISYHGSLVHAIVIDGHSVKTVKFSPERTDEVLSLNLCPQKKLTQGSQLSITLLSEEDHPVEVEVKVEIETHWLAWRGKNHSEHLHQEEVELSLSSPIMKSFLYSLHGEEDLKGERLLVTAETLEGSDSFCNLISIQPPQCPCQDEVSSAVRVGRWQSMINKTAIVVEKKDFPDGFLVVIVSIQDSKELSCFSKGNEFQINRDLGRVNKKLMISVSSNKDDDYIGYQATAPVLLLYLVIAFVAFGISVSQFEYNINLFDGFQRQQNTLKRKYTDNCKINFTHSTPDIKVQGLDRRRTQEDIEFEESLKSIGNPLEDEHQKEINIPTTSKSYIAEEECFRYSNTPLNFSRLKTSLFVSDLSASFLGKDTSIPHYRKDRFYISHLVIISLVYSLLVFQIAIQSAEKQKDSGNNNMCFFNNLCQKPLGPFMNFNQIFSNFGYVFFGIIFIGIVWIHQLRYNQLVAKEEGRNYVLSLYGIPQQYGVYYSMGGALVMEGLMSAAFHICPSRNSFQFDTTFMYLIAILMYVKLYQNRHPDISCNAETAFYILVIALVIEVISVYFGSPVFWIIFCSLYICGTCILAAKLYNMGAAKTDRFMVMNIVKIFLGELSQYSSQARERRLPRVRPILGFLLVICALNIFLCVLFLRNYSFNKVGASTYLLIMFISNMFLYLFYYIIMKLVNKERPCYQAVIYGVLAMLVGNTAMYFFAKFERNVGLSAAESRDLNMPCLFMDYYDRHDVWHFISAAGLFFSFMVFLTIDEDLKYKKRSDIPVF